MVVPVLIALFHFEVDPFPSENACLSIIILSKARLRLASYSKIIYYP
jgi:hypothetical protein